MRAICAASFAIVALALPGTAWSICRGPDLAGTFTVSAKSSGGYGTVETTCEIVVAQDGTVESGAVCRSASSKGGVTEAKVDGGRFDISRACVVRGQIVIDGNSSLVTFARMDRAKKKVYGTGTNVVDGSPLSFTAIRKEAAVAVQQPSPTPDPAPTRVRRRSGWFWN